jgi:2-polyprenyl-3-methyl-5-hydroxy-6-metoxy-1,4-benzoquinol methylase
MLNGWFYLDDLTEAYIKLRQRGFGFLASKLNLSPTSRTQSAFDAQFPHANWWIVPRLKKRNNFIITDDENVTYEKYVTQKYFSQDTKKLISFGCGSGSHELTFAKYNPQLEVIGYDISPSLINIANEQAKEQKLSNAKFICKNISSLVEEDVDVVLFHSSLHHFDNLDTFIPNIVCKMLKKNGYLILHEYVGEDRLQFDDKAYYIANKVLKQIPQESRRILNTSMIKNKCYRSGKARMIIADPSECKESSKILPLIHHYFHTLEEKNLGGEILTLALKHIAHHFEKTNQDLLDRIIAVDNEYSLNTKSSYIFGFYKMK